MKRIAGLLLAMIAGLLLLAPAAAEKIITLTFTGDCTLGSEEKTRNNPDSFDHAAEKNGTGYFFEGFRGLFSRDDCTVVNLEGILADSSEGEVMTRTFRLRGAEEFVNILKEGSVEAVSLANNHAGDYGTKGLENTKRVLVEAGISWVRDEDLYILEKDGIRIAFAAVDYNSYYRSNYVIREKLLALKKNGEISASVILIHEGKKLFPKHLDRQVEYSEYFVKTAGADLVIMHHPHVVQGIRILDNRSIFYSLGDFISGGHSELTRGEKGTYSLYSLVVQARMHFSDDGVYLGQQMILYPAYGSGTEPRNNYQPVRVTAEQALPVMEAVQFDTEWQLPPLQTDSSGYAYAVMDYLPAEDSRPEETGPEEEKPEAALPEPDRNR